VIGRLLAGMTGALLIEEMDTLLAGITGTLVLEEIDRLLVGLETTEEVYGVGVGASDLDAPSAGKTTCVTISSLWKPIMIESTHPIDAI
jgi:hypothetical protein